MHAVSEHIEKSCVVWMGRFPADYAACTAAATPKPTLQTAAPCFGRGHDDPNPGSWGLMNLLSECVKLARRPAPPPGSTP